MAQKLQVNSCSGAHGQAQALMHLLRHIKSFGTQVRHMLVLKTSVSVQCEDTAYTGHALAGQLRFGGPSAIDEVSEYDCRMCAHSLWQKRMESTAALRSKWTLWLLRSAQALPIQLWHQI